MVRSELIEKMIAAMPGLSPRDIELTVKIIQDHMIDNLANGGRIEVRGFGSFSLNYRKPKMARNPRTGESVPLSGRHVVHFKPGKELREMVDHPPAG
ncbi:MAG: integration host factor subunit beta [Gammaproteobacteria bacterium]